MKGFESKLQLVLSFFVKFILVTLSAKSVARENALNLNKLNTGPSLVEKIRRQLMEDNYDYMPSEENTTATLQYEDVTETITMSSDPRSAVVAGEKPDQQDKNLLSKTPNLPTGFSDHRDIETKNLPNQENTTHSSSVSRNKLRDNTININFYEDQESKNSSKYAEDERFYKSKQPKTSDYRDRYSDQYLNHVNNPLESRELGSALDDEHVEGTKYTINYDASSAEEQQLTTVQHKRHFYDRDVIPRAFVSSRNEVDRGFSVGHQDLLYYMDDKRMRRMEDDQKSMNAAASAELGDYGDATESSTTTVKYKVIKVKSSNPSRRNIALRRFVEEKNSEGVAIFRLDDEPFPQFRLPHHRRQYMSAYGDPNKDNTPDSSISS